MSEIDIRITRAESGVCQRCGAQTDEMYHVAILQNGREKNYKLCRNCAAAAKRSVNRKKQEIEAQRQKLVVPVIIATVVIMVGLLFFVGLLPALLMKNQIIRFEQS